MAPVIALAKNHGLTYGAIYGVYEGNLDSLGP